MALEFLNRLFGGPKTEALPEGTPAPAFTLADGSGHTYSLEEACRQGLVLLAFFKVTCPTSQFTFDFLERLHRATKASGKVSLWGISQDDADDTADFARELGLTFPLLLDEEGYPVSNAYNLSYVPTLFLVTPSGDIRASSVGFNRTELEVIAESFAEQAGQSFSLFRPDEKIPDHRAG